MQLTLSSQTVGWQRNKVTRTTSFIKRSVLFDVHEFLAACMGVHHMRVWCPRRSGKDTGSLGTRVTHGLSCVGAEN